MIVSRKKKYSGRRAGFTLLELALVIGFFGALFVMLMGMNMAIDRLARQSSGASIAKKEALKIFQLMLSSLSNTFFVPNQKSLIFEGKQEGAGQYRQDKLTFATIDPYVNALNREAEAKEVTYYLKKNSDSDRFRLIRREDAVVDKYPRSGGVHNILLDGVKSLEFQYNKRLDGERWEDSWDSGQQKRPPAKIKIKLTIAISEGRDETLEGVSHPGILTPIR